MWRLKACLRLILPEPVTLKRFDAPELGFTFGIVNFILQFWSCKGNYTYSNCQTFMLFLLKTLFYGFVLFFISHLSVYAQSRENKPSNTEQLPTMIPKDSIRKYWIEMFDSRNFVWMGVGMNVSSTRFLIFADEATFVPKYKKDLYGLRLRVSLSGEQAGLPAAYTREVSALYGKVYKAYRFMATASTGISYFWGRKWTDQIGMISTPAARGLRTNAGTYPLYNVEAFRTIGVPIRGQAFFIAGKEVALGITLGTTLNTKQVWFDAMFTFLLGIN